MVVSEPSGKRMASSNTSSQKGVGNLTLDKAAFLLIRIKRIFVKKKNKGRGYLEKPPGRKKPPLLRARTLPAIICPSLNIIQAQLEGDRHTPAGSGCEFKPRRHFSGSSAAKVKAAAAHERERCYLEPEFEPVKSPLGSPRASVTSVTSCSSTQSVGKDSSRQKYEITKAGLARFAKRLTSKDKTSNSKVMHNFPSSIPNIEVTPLRRSGSVDSLLDSNLYSIDASDISNCSSMACLAPSCSSTNLTPINLSPTGSLTVPGDRTLPTSPSVPAKLEAHRRGDIPSSPSVPNKLAKGISGQCLESPEVLLEGLPLSKTERKRLEKLNKINIDLQALFVSVEHEHLERARSILSSTDVNVNCVNSDGFTPLDIAVMILDISMAKLLQAYGGRESTRFRTKESRCSQLVQLVKEAERCVDDLTTCVLSVATTGSLSIALIKEKEKQLSLWRRRQTLLRRMKSGFDKLQVPGAPSLVILEVVGTKALRVKFTENESSQNAETIVTKYKVEWSVRGDFRPLSGSREVLNLQRLEMVLTDLIHGVPYHVRVAAGNSKGYGPYTESTPAAAAPSSWMDINGRKSRSVGRLCQLDCVFHQIIFTRPPCSSEIKDIIFGNTLETPQQQRRQVRKSIKNLFTPTPKFQKNMKRGVYLACLMYTDHRVLVTTEDTLPIMEVDETCPSCLHNDFHWLMKVACTWEDTKALRVEMEKTQSSSAIHFRIKLLQTSEMMQTALGVQDLGQFYYKPIKDPDDTTVLCTVKHVPDSKSLNNLSLRWVPLAKLQRKLSINSDSTQDVYSVNSLLLSSTQAMMAYNHMSRIPLPRGLYIAYVKISSSVDLIRVLVPKKAPNVLPYYKIRENPHVSAEEWAWLKSTATEIRAIPSASQFKFQKAISSATRSLLTLLELSVEQTGEHRIYDGEVIELNPDVSLVLLLPPVDSVCSAPGQRDDVTDRSDCVLLPLQIFEMIHMNTYQNTFISRYSRISSILEMDTIVAQHEHRQAFSTIELSSAKSRLRQLQQFQSQVDSAWRSMRWLMDVLNFARDKHQQGGIQLSHALLDRSSPSTSPPQSPQHSQSLHTLQVPNEILGMKKFPTPTISIRITNSTSSHSLTEAQMPSTDDLAIKPNTEMRRCASTSGLVLNSESDPEEGRNSPPRSLDLPTTHFPTVFSSESVSVTYQLEGSDYGDVTSLADDDSKVCEANGDVHEDDLLSQEGIMIRVGSAASSNDGLSNQDLENFDDDISDISDYKEQNMDEVLKLEQSEEEDSCDGGLQFKIKTESHEGSVDDYDFVTYQVQSDEFESDEDIRENELVISVADLNESSSVVRLQLDPDAKVHEIVDAVLSQLGNSSEQEEENESKLDGCNVRLFATFGETERLLNDSFQPLKVQNPWTKGKLCVKRRTDDE